MISLKDINKTYVTEAGLAPVLHNINLDVKQGEYLCIRGSSGSGKSTLLNILGCLDSPTSGQIKILDEDVHDTSEDERTRIRRERIGFVFQKFHLIPNYNALRNVELPLIYAKTAQSERLDRAEAMLNHMGLSHRLDHLPNQLSGGEQQRVAIARAIVNNPDILIADEPTGALDEKSGKVVMKIFGKLNELGVTLILVTHDDAVAKHARRTVTIRGGRLTESS